MRQRRFRLDLPVLGWPRAATLLLALILSAASASAAPAPAPEDSASDRAVAAALARAQAAIAAGQMVEADQEFREAIKQADLASRGEVLLAAYGGFARFLLEQGKDEAAEAAWERARQKAAGREFAAAVGQAQAGLGEVAWRRGRLDAAAKHLDAAMQTAKDTRNVGLMYDAAGLRALVALDGGHVAQAQELALGAEKLARVLKDPAKLARAQLRQAEAALALGRFDEALRLAEAAEPGANTDPDRLEIARVRGRVYQARGQLDRAGEAWAEAAKLATAARSADGQAEAALGLAAVQLGQGQKAEAAQAVAEVQQRLEKLDRPVRVLGLGSQVWRAWFMLGKAPEAEQALRRLVAAMDRSGLLDLRVRARLEMAEYHLARSNPIDAEDALRGIAAEAPALGQHGALAALTARLGQIQLAGGRAEEAAGLALQALEVALRAGDDLVANFAGEVFQEACRRCVAGKKPAPGLDKLYVDLVAARLAAGAATVARLGVLRGEIVREPKEAERWSRRALELTPADDRAARAWLEGAQGVALLSQGRHDEAEQHLRAAVSHLPGCPNHRTHYLVYLNLGLCLHQAKRPPVESLGWYVRAAEAVKTPRDGGDVDRRWQALALMLMVYLDELKQPEKAAALIPELAELAGKAPHRGEALQRTFDLAGRMFGAKRAEDAIKLVQAAEALLPNPPDPALDVQFYFGAFQIAAAADDLPLTKKWLDRFVPAALRVREFEKAAVACLQVAARLGEHKDYAAAQQYREAALKLVRQYKLPVLLEADYHSGTGWDLLQRTLPDQAMEPLTEALRLYGLGKSVPGQVKALTHLAAACRSRADRAGQRKYLTQLRDLLLREGQAEQAQAVERELAGVR